MTGQTMSPPTQAADTGTDTGTGTDTDTAASAPGTPRTMAQLVGERASRRGAHTAVVDPDHRLSYAELDAAARDLASVLVERGVTAGSRVGLIAPNSTRWVIVAVAVTRIGAVLVPLSTLLAPRELCEQLRTAAVEYLISVDEFRGHRYLDAIRAELDADPQAPDALPHPLLPALRDVVSLTEICTAHPRPELRAVVDALGAAVAPSDPLIIIFTSGSSGPPKGVIHSHSGALGAVAASLAARLIGEGSRLYLPMPFFWVGGFGAGLLSALIAGATLVTEPRPSPETTLALLAAEQVTLFRGWPDQAAALARHPGIAEYDLSSLRVGSLPALLPPDERPAPGTRADLFGMTESFGPYCGYPADVDLPASAHGSCGKPFAGMEVRILDRDGDRPVAPGETGEIALRGPHVMLGICGRSREEVFTADGFYRTGDLGRLDAEGFLFHQGRADDMFKVSGATVYPSEVTAALRSIDGVDAAYVTRVDGTNGPCVGAAVVCTTPLTADDLRSRARKVLSSFKIPTVWLILDSDDTIPRGGTGKVQAEGLRKLLEAVS